MRSATFLFYLLTLLPSAGFGAPVIINSSASKTVRTPLTETSPRVSYYAFKSPSAKHQTFKFDISGPAGTLISIFSAKAPPKTAKDVAKKSGLIYPTLLHSLTGSSNKSIRLGSASSGDGNSGGGGGGGGAGSEQYVCGCLTAKTINDIRNSFAQLGINYSEADICQQFSSAEFCTPTPPPIGNPPGGGGTGSTSKNEASLSAFIQDDACDSKPPVAVVKVDLSKVKTTDLTGGAITIKPKFEDFSGSKKAKIKRQGEGKYKGSLLLAAPVAAISFTSSLGDVRLTTWKGDRRTKERSIKVADYVFYPPAGGLLWRIPLPSDIFTGGKGTFELRSADTGHSICAPLVRKDQFFNGYPNNSRGGDESSAAP
jgi:hypothetical protein